MTPRGEMAEADLGSAYAGARVLVTGGVGFIGSNLAAALLAAGSDVLLVDSMVPKYGGNFANLDGFRDRLTVNVSDIRDEHSLRHLVQGVDYIFNLAGQTSHVDSMTDPSTDLDINCRSQLSILEACRHHNPGAKVVFASTRQIYGRPRYLPVDENHPVAPVDVNGINKTAGEWYHLLYGQVYGLRVSVLRLTNTYGPRMRVRDARQTFLGIWVRLLLEGKQFVIFGDGMQKRDLSYVDDTVRAFMLAGASEHANGKVFNLGDANVVSLLELAEALVAVNGSGSFRLEPFPEDRRLIDIGDYFADYSKIERELGWRPHVGLEEGLGRTLDYYRRYGNLYWEES